MRQCLLDTNILSELAKPVPDPQVTHFVSGLGTAWLSIITLHEVEYGIQLLPHGKRRTQLKSMIERLLRTYADHVLPVDQAVVHQAANLKARMQQVGKVMHLADALIAGTAIAHDLTLVTRNTKDFAGLAVDLHDPFMQAPFVDDQQN